jgi:polysaccharide export outer membrane protein
MEQPEIAVDVLAYNSKVIYIVMDGGGFGEQVVRVPYTGNETVLDAIAQVNGLSRISSKKVWVARPAPGNVHRTQILDVHWQAITAEGITTTNYQLLPGDRIYVQADSLIATDNFLSKLFAPVERVFGIVLLGKVAESGGQNNN